MCFSSVLSCACTSSDLSVLCPSSGLSAVCFSSDLVRSRFFIMYVIECVLYHVCIEYVCHQCFFIWYLMSMFFIRAVMLGVGSSSRLSAVCSSSGIVLFIRSFRNVSMFIINPSSKGLVSDTSLSCQREVCLSSVCTS